MQYRAALFDLDGTLVDTDELVVSAFQHALELQGRPPADPAAIRRSFGRPHRQVFAELSPRSAEACAAAYREYFRVHHDRLVAVLDGASDTLRALRAAGIRIGVVTSRLRESAVASLRRVGLEAEVDVVVGGDDVESPKPAGEPVERAAAALGVPPAACLMIGDSPHDIESGRAAGARTAAVRWTRVDWPAVLAAGPDHVVDAMADLPALFREP